jgi:DHA2 family methylenomycin A resistance protein-like MFS transporter
VAGALVIPNGLALVREDTPGESLGSRLGLIGAALTLGAAAGPPLGGGLLAAWGWRAIFLVNVPAAGLAILLSVRALPRGRVPLPVEPTQRRLGRLPPALVAAGSAIALSNLAMYVMLLSIPLLLDRRPGVGSGEVGLVLACLSFTTAAVSPVGGRLSDRVGRRAPAVAGAIVVALSLIALALDPAMATIAVAVALLVAGTGIGLMTPALQTAAIESVAVDDAGTAAGLAATSRYVGSIAGTVLLAGALAPDPTGTGGFGLLYATLAGCAAASLGAALLLPGRRPAPGTAADPVPGPAPMAP